MEYTHCRCINHAVLARILSDHGRRGIQIFTTCRDPRQRADTTQSNTFVIQKYTVAHHNPNASLKFVPIGRSHVTSTAAANIIS